MRYLDSATFHVRFNLIMVGVWIVLLPPTLVWWQNSVPYLVLLSWWANFASHLAAWIAAKAERNAES